MGWLAKARQRVLRANTPKAKNKIPAVNLERSAPAKLRPNNTRFFRLGFCHVSAKRHKVSKENRVTAMSVWTIGPKARKAGVLTKTLRQSSPPQSPPRRRASTHRSQP